MNKTRSFRGLRFVRRGFSVFLSTLILSAFPITVPLSAQDTSVSVGMKGGLNLSRFYGARIGDSESLESVVFGVFAQFGIGGAFSLQPEISYSKRGAREDDLLEAASDGVWHYNYFDAAALLRFRVNSRQSSPSLSLFTGPVLSVLGSSKATGWEPEGLHRACQGCALEPISFRYVRLLNPNTEGTDFGGTLGMAIDFGTGPARLVLDVRYTKMMREIDRAPYNDLYSRKHSLLSFQLGFSVNASAWGGGRIRRPSPVDDPDRHSIVTLDVITREDIAARDETFSVYDIIRLERPEWMDGGEIRATLFVDGQLWDGSPELLRERRGAEVEEILRMEGAPGAYAGHGVVIEIISRGGS